MSTLTSMKGNPDKKPTPAERLHWWKNFDYPVYEISNLIAIFGSDLVGLFPASKQQAFQNALVTLQNVAATLHNDQIKKVIAALEKGEEPNVPDIPLPDVPPWNPDEPNTQHKFKNILNVLIPFVQGLSEKFGKDSDIGLAILDLFSAAEDVVDQLQTVNIPR